VPGALVRPPVHRARRICALRAALEQQLEDVARARKDVVDEHDVAERRVGAVEGRERDVAKDGELVDAVDLFPVGRARVAHDVVVGAEGAQGAREVRERGDGAVGRAVLEDRDVDVVRAEERRDGEEGVREGRDDELAVVQVEGDERLGPWCCCRGARRSAQAVVPAHERGRVGDARAPQVARRRREAELVDEPPVELALDVVDAVAVAVAGRTIGFQPLVGRTRGGKRRRGPLDAVRLGLERRRKDGRREGGVAGVDEVGAPPDDGGGEEGRRGEAHERARVGERREAVLAAVGAQGGCVVARAGRGGRGGASAEVERGIGAVRGGGRWRR